MRETFIDRRFSAASLALIETANSIIAEYQAQGFSLTLRQLYYQFVARDIIRNRQTEYKRLGSVINDARLAGLIDWSAIEDRTRNVRRTTAWDSPAAIMESVADQYKENPWLTQRWVPEVWIEKDALVGVIEPVCTRWRVPYFACRGYTSQSETYAAGVRFRNIKGKGQCPIMFHLGDHDPSGLDMTRDNTDRLTMFARFGVPVQRLALNLPQIEQYGPPPNPAKDSDSRFGGYNEEYGAESWELDALDPTVIDGIIERAIVGLLDRAQWDASLAEEAERRTILETISANWDEVEAFTRDL